MSSVKAERVIKEIVNSAPIAQSDDDIISEEGGSHQDEQLSKLVREVARSWPINRGSDDYCALSDLVVFITTSAVVDRESGGSEGVYDKYYFQLHQADGNYSDAAGDPSFKKDKKLAKQASGISPDDWAERFYNLQDLTAHDDVHLSKETLVLLGQQMSEHVSGEGKRITWDSMVDFVSFASSDRSSGKKSSNGNRARKTRARFMAMLKKQFDLTNIEAEFSYISKKDKTHGTHIVDSKRFHDFVEKRLHWDLTEAEVKEVLREISERGSRSVGGVGFTDVVDENVLRNYLSNSAASRRGGKEEDNVIVDLVVGEHPPDQIYEAVTLCREDEHDMVDTHTSVDLSVSMFSAKSKYIWVLKRKDIKGVGKEMKDGHVSAGTTRLMPIVDVRIEAEDVDSALVAAGYTCCSKLDSIASRKMGASDLDNSSFKLGRAAVDKHRFLWIRRAVNHVEARDHAIVDLVGRRGKYSDRRDKMHAAPGDKDTWFEVMGRQQHSMKLQMKRRGSLYTDDIKLWGNRVESSKWSQLDDRLSKSIALKVPGKEMTFMRELETAIRFSLRQKHLRRGEMTTDDLTEPIDAAALFNDHISGSSTKLNKLGWNKVLKSCGLYVEPREMDLLFRRLSRTEVTRGTITTSVTPAIERADFISFVSKTEFELEETAFHLKEELQRRHQLKASNPRIKRRHVERLRSMFLRACTTHDVRRGDRALSKSLAQHAGGGGVVHHSDGLSMDHFGLMLKCINEYLTEPEQHRLVLRFDPDFRGSVNVDKLLEFISSEHDAPRERAERVLLAAQTLSEFVLECRVHAGDGSKTSQAWNLLVDERRRRRQLPKQATGLLACFSSTSGLDEALDPDDLSIAVERRGAHTSGIRGALRLSAYEARRLAMLVAPENKMGKVGAEEFSYFFSSSPPRPLGEVLDALSEDAHMGGILEGYKKWYTSEFNDKKLRMDYQQLRDDKVRFITDQASDSISSSSDPSVSLERMFNIDWTCDENPNGDNPFNSASEIALVALHIGADDIAEVSMFEDEQSSVYNVRVRSFLDGVARLIYGDIEAVEGGRVDVGEPPVSKMAAVCRDLVRDVRRGALDGRRSPSYALWVRRSLSEFRNAAGEPLATDEEIDAWCPASAARSGEGVPLLKFAELLSALDMVFGWNLGTRKIRVWARDWDTDQNDRIKEHEVAAFVDGTSKAYTESTHYFDSDRHLGDAIKFHLGDAAAEGLVLKIVKQLKAKETLADAISLLQRAFSHPMVDPYPPKGVVGLSEFRKALSYGGIQIGYDELELGVEFFFESNSGVGNGVTMYSKGHKEINYERFIQCVRRAWMLGEASGEATMTGDKALDTKLEALRRAIQKGSRDRNARSAPQKVFRKVDSDKDGRITPDEFAEALRSMKIEVKLSREELNRLFAFFDDDYDNTMDYEEFYYFMQHGRIGETHAGGKGRGRALVGDADSDSDGDVDFVTGALTTARTARQDVFKDLRAAIYKKYTTRAQMEMLKNYIKSKDLNEDGTISEKVFMRFLRKADLLNGLSRKNLQQIVTALDPQQTHWINYGLFFRKAMEKVPRADDEETKDYDRYYGGGGSKKRDKQRKDAANPILQHILDCAARSHQAGRPFHAFFPDPTGRGAVSREVAIAALRDGLGCNLTNEEMDLVFDTLPERNDFLVEYGEIYSKLLTTTPRFGGTPGAGLPYTGAPAMTGFQPFNTTATPMTPYPAANTGGVTFAATPYPAAPMNPMMGNPMLNQSVNGSFVSGYGQTMGGMGMNTSFAGREEHLVEDLLKQVQRMCRDKAMQWGGSFSLQRFFQQSADGMQTGYVSVYDFQSVMNKLGLAISHAELQSVQRRFGQPGGMGSIDYHSFCRSVDRTVEGDINNVVEMLANRLAEQRRKGFDIRLSFEMNDSGNTGYVSSEDFKDAIRQLGLPMTESQTTSLAAKFAHGATRDRINYNEFLQFMNRSVPFLDLSSSMIDRTRLDNSIDRASFDFGDRFGGDFGAPSPKERAQKRDLYTGMRRFRDNVDAGGSMDFDDPGSVTSKYSAFGKSGRVGSRSPTKDAQREHSVAVWGVGTPLQSRGEVPQSTRRALDEQDKWMCLVCLSENSNGNSNCNVCGALNPKSNQAQVVNECPVCHFQNPEGTVKCDMCGHQLIGGGGRSTTRTKSQTQTWRTGLDEEDGFLDDSSGFLNK